MVLYSFSPRRERGAERHPKIKTLTVRLSPRPKRSMLSPSTGDTRAMAEERVQRRLAAILAADVAGYSRLMGVDEEGTLSALKELRRELADPKIKEHRGRIVKTTGDGLLVEFASVVDAVRCAVEVQFEMAERNAGMPEEQRIEFRIGINLGDIIQDGRDIHGWASLIGATGMGVKRSPRSSITGSGPSALKRSAPTPTRATRPRKRFSCAAA